ncbi:PP2C family protein-serine/threonine phosphatase [Sediminitomix flava]|nr:SpoIIE family protein phosphatase [Sediminitomix flava]
MIAYPIWCISDPYVVGEFAMEFITIRLTLTFCFGVGLFLLRNDVIKPLTQNYFLFLSIGISLAYMGAVGGKEVTLFFSLGLTTTFIGGNIIGFWNPIHSFIVLSITYICLAIFYGLWGYSESFLELVSDGLGVFIFVAPLSCLQMWIRYKSTKSEIEAVLSLSKVNQELKASNQKINQQKSQLESVYQNITNSVTYAKGIQEGFLPTDQKLNEFFTNSVILYQPRDIVSGDFYWWKETSNHFYVACSDCTGHGVPGAFLTLVGKMILDNILERKPDILPSNLLGELDQRFREKIEKTSEDHQINDGMDIAVLRLDKDKNEYLFAGAKRPLWLCRNEQILEYSATNRSIVGLIDKQNIPFEDATLDVQKGDTIYMFTDGLSDQFGGERDKKFLLKRCKESLIKPSNSSLENHISIFQNTWNDWKGNTSQTDDILLIALEV